jgi:hypothetical protein
MNYKAEIIALKSLLADTDYKTLKHADGAMSDEEYESVRAQREEWRRLINEYEEKAKDMEESKFM